MRIAMLRMSRWDGLVLLGQSIWQLCVCYDLQAIIEESEDGRYIYGFNIVATFLSFGRQIQNDHDVGGKGQNDLVDYLS